MRSAAAGTNLLCVQPSRVVLPCAQPPFLHTAPALVINEDELRDGFDRVDRALYTLDKGLGF